MDREYLEDYEKKENERYERLVRKRIANGEFSFLDDFYPPDSRFIKPKKPFAITSRGASKLSNIWGQVPFVGSLLIPISSFPRKSFEEKYFRATEIPKLIDFIKDTGKIQIALGDAPTSYAHLNFLEPIFRELEPPSLGSMPLATIGNEQEIKKAVIAYQTLGRIRFFDFLAEVARVEYMGTLSEAKHAVKSLQNAGSKTYVTLKLRNYSIHEHIDDLMIDDPQKACYLLSFLGLFVINPFMNLRGSLHNFTLKEAKLAYHVPIVYRPKEIRFPCEIGKFLVKKMTNAPLGERACYNIIDHYESYDLQKVQKSLNDGIINNNPDIVAKSSDEFDEILENVWNDPIVPKRIKNLKRGLHVSVAAIGAGVSALTGGLGGFLAGLGFGVGSGFLKADIETTSEKIAKFFSRGYQANIYDFKKIVNSTKST